MTALQDKAAQLDLSQKWLLSEPCLATFYLLFKLSPTLSSPFVSFCLFLHL